MILVYYISIVILAGAIFLQLEYPENKLLQYIIPTYIGTILTFFLLKELKKIKLQEKNIEIENNVRNGNIKREKFSGIIENVTFKYIRKRPDALTISHYKVIIDIAISYNNSIMYHQISKDIHNISEELKYELSKVYFGFDKNTLDENEILKNYYKKDFYEGKTVSIYLDPKHKEEPILADNLFSSINKENSKTANIGFYVFGAFSLIIIITYIIKFLQ